MAVATKIPPDLICHADRNRLRQILVNLLDNAIKYTRKEVAWKSRLSLSGAKCASR